jgi:hypothetical protein
MKYINQLTIKQAAGFFKGAVSWERSITWARIPIVVIATAFPVVFAKHIESVEPRFLVGFVMLVAIASGVEVLYDHNMTLELEKARRHLQIQEARGLTLGRLLELLSPVSAVLTYKNSLTAVQRKAAAKRIDEAIVEVLKAVCEYVWTYWNPYGSTAAPIRGSVMVAHVTATCDASTLAALASRGTKNKVRIVWAC